VTGGSGRWKLDVRPQAERRLARLPEKVGAALAEFIAGPLLDNPHRVGHPLAGEYEGWLFPARRPRRSGEALSATGPGWTFQRRRSLQTDAADVHRGLGGEKLPGCRIVA
jgi:hypothetical protein